MLATSHVYFPLRSNVGYFDTAGRGRMSLEARVKQMAILSNEILFEPGLLTVDVTESMVFPLWQPPHHIDEERIREHRRAAQIGEPVYLGIGAQPSKGVPAREDAMRQLGGGQLQAAYVAEYHSLAKESGLLGQPWVTFGVVAPEGLAELNELIRAEDQADFFDRDKPKLSENPLLDSTLRKDLNKDLSAGATFGVPVAVDELHAPMLRHKATRNADIEAEDFPGRQALSLWVPDFSGVPWKDIIGLHDHDAIGAFREKLILAEQEVAHLEDREREEAIKDLGIRELAKKLRQYQPSGKSVAIDVGLDLAAGMLPLGVGSAAVSAARGAVELQEARSEWTAVYLRLMQSTGASSAS